MISIRRGNYRPHQLTFVRESLCLYVCICFCPRPRLAMTLLASLPPKCLLERVRWKADSLLFPPRIKSSSIHALKWRMSLSPESPAATKGAIQEIDRLLANCWPWPRSPKAHGRRIRASGPSIPGPSRSAAPLRASVKVALRCFAPRSSQASIGSLADSVPTHWRQNQRLQPRQTSGRAEPRIHRSGLRENVLENVPAFLQGSHQRPNPAAFPMSHPFARFTPRSYAAITAKDAGEQARWKADGMMATEPDECCWYSDRRLHPRSTSPTQKKRAAAPPRWLARNAEAASSKMA